MAQSKTFNFYQDLLNGGCPWCGESLVIKQGKFGEFVACSEWCGYTKSVPGRSEFPPPKNKRLCPYKKCDGSGLLPFVGKDGNVRNDTFLFCDCHSQYGIDVKDHYHTPRLEDYDFPCSDTFRSWSYEYCGETDPGYIPNIPEVRQLKYWVEQAKAGYLHLQNKLNEHLDRAKNGKGKDRI